MPSELCSSSLYSSVAERQSCKLKVLGSIPSGGFLDALAHSNCHHGLGIRFCVARLACTTVPFWCRLLCVFGVRHFCLPMSWCDVFAQCVSWKGWEPLAQSRQRSLHMQSSRARGVVVSHPLSMREALGSIPSVSILAPYADRNWKGKTQRAQAARPAIMAPCQLAAQSGQQEHSGPSKLADCCAPWGAAVQHSRRKHARPQSVK